MSLVTGNELLFFPSFPVLLSHSPLSPLTLHSSLSLSPPLPLFLFPSPSSSEHTSHLKKTIQTQLHIWAGNNRIVGVRQTSADSFLHA